MRKYDEIDFDDDEYVVSDNDFVSVTS